MRSYVAVTISRKQETLSLQIPFFCYTEKSTFDRYRDQREETDYVCEKRNRAMTKALEKYPSATHVLSLDSYYLNQASALRELPKDTKHFPQIVQVPSLGNCVVFPAWVWKKYGFLTPEPFPHVGSCYTRLCKISGLPVLMDMKARLVRDRTNNPEAYYPLTKRFRVSVGDYKNRLLRQLSRRSC